MVEHYLWVDLPDRKHLSLSQMASALEQKKPRRLLAVYVDFALPYGAKLPIVLLFLLMEQGVMRVGGGPINP